MIDYSILKNVFTWPFIKDELIFVFLSALVPKPIMLPTLLGIIVSGVSAGKLRPKWPKGHLPELQELYEK